MEDFTFIADALDIQFFFAKGQYENVVAFVGNAGRREVPAVSFRCSLGRTETALANINHACWVLFSVANRERAFDVVTVGFTTKVQIVFLKERCPVVKRRGDPFHCWENGIVILSQQPAVFGTRCFQFLLQPFGLIAAGTGFSIERDQANLGAEIDRVIIFV